MLSIDYDQYDQMSNVFVQVNFGASNHNFNIPLMQKFKISARIYLLSM